MKKSILWTQSALDQLGKVKDKTGKRKSKNRKINKVRIDGEYIVVGSYDISIKAILQALSEKNGKDYFSV